MKIKEIHLSNYKRFTDLTITGLPTTTKLVVLVGPNGCGKSSVFDAFKTWHLYKAYGNGSDNDYCKKNQQERRQGFELVNIQFHDNVARYTYEQFQETFYFRTAYRNTPQISIQALQKVPSPLSRVDHRMMIQNDSTIDENYQRLISATINELYDDKNNEKKVVDLRNELIDEIRGPLHRLFPDLLLTGVGMITEKAEFYFDKGITHRYGYEKLSGGEKAAFDLILDFVIKRQFYSDTIFCIDEPEAHIHTSLQSKVLSEMFSLVPDNSQLWIATHSFGMMKEAKRLYNEYPGQVIFLDFDGYDFDERVILTPSQCDNVLWKKMMEIALEDYAPFMSPETVVFCEGSTSGKKRKDFDAQCYQSIFTSTHPSTMFYSLGGCNDVVEKENIVRLIQTISPNTKVIKIIDRDDRSQAEINELQQKGVKVLSRRHIESYLLDDEVLDRWCEKTNQPQRKADIKAIKAKCLANSCSRGNPSDDIKSASNEICTEAKKLLGITGCGSNGEAIMRDALAPLITPDMAVFRELEQSIFF